MKSPDIFDHEGPTGGPAFPIETSDGYYSGMSMRDYFAGQALATMIAATAIKPWSPELYAEMSYRVADAMLAEMIK